MPQIFKIGSYTVYFWMNEGIPLEPVHVHVAKGIPSKNATKIWITKHGKCLLCNNNPKIPKKTLNTIIKISKPKAAILSNFGFLHLTKLAIFVDVLKR